MDGPEPADAGSDRPRLLVRFDNPARPSFHPWYATDRYRFYFTIDDRQRDIYVAELQGLRQFALRGRLARERMDACPEGHRGSGRRAGVHQPFGDGLHAHVEPFQGARA